MCTDGLANVGLGGLDGKLVATCTLGCYVHVHVQYSRLLCTCTCTCTLDCYVHVRVRVH